MGILPCNQAAGFRRLDARQADILISSSEGLCIFEVRDPIAYAQGHIDGARPLSPSDLKTVLHGTPRQQPVLIYCHHGITSQQYAMAFAEFGYAEVYDLMGGFQAWRTYLESRDRRGAPALPEALAMWLADQGFPPNDVNAADFNQSTPLMYAARLGETVIAEALLDCGAEINRRNADGNHALWFACFSGNIELIRLLVTKGAHLDNQNDNGATCLMYAASSGKAEAVAALLEAGAGLDPKTLDDFTALDMAANVECLTLLRHAAARQR